MPLTLKLVDTHQLMPNGDIVRELDQGTMTIGRAEQNDWILPDPERVISSQHCSIEAASDGVRLTDTSSNGVFHNGADAPIGRGNTVELSDGDQIRISHFVIDVSVAAQADAPNQTADWADPAPRSAPLSDDPFARDGLNSPATDMNINDILEGPAPSGPVSPGPMSSDRVSLDPVSLDPMSSGSGYGTPGADIFGGSETIPADADFTAPVDVSATDQAFFQPPETNSQIPDDWDKDWSPESGQAQGIPATGPAPDPAQGAGIPAADPFADAPAVIPDEWDTDEPSPAAPQAIIPEDPFAEPAPPAPAGIPASEPLSPESLAPESLPPQPEPPIQAAPIPAAPIAQPAPVQAPPVQEIPAQPAPVSPPGPAPDVARSGASVQAAVKAFLEGAELDDVQIGDQEAEEAMRLVGAFYRETVKSLMEVLAARSSIKSEFRLSQTVIKPVENNPLKFSLGATDAMTALLTKRGRDYLPPLASLQQAFDDVKAHQVAVMVGMQVAITDLLKRFDPAAIERRIEQDGKGGSFSLKGRDSKYWAEFTRLYETLASEAEDDFQSLFGREFAKAYEDQVRKLAARGEEK